MAGAAIGIAAVGTIASAVGTISAGQAAKRRGKFQAAVATQQATRERQVAAGNERDFRKSQSAKLASFRATAGNLTGSQLLSAEDFAGETELNALRIRDAGEVRGTRLEQQASLLTSAGKSAATAGFIRGGASLLTGFSSLGSKFGGKTGFGSIGRD